jgi:hypothetical protein
MWRIRMEREAQKLEEDAEEGHSYNFFLWAQCS